MRMIIGDLALKMKCRICDKLVVEQDGGFVKAERTRTKDGTFKVTCAPCMKRN